jgi:hypothetical protein
MKKKVHLFFYELKSQSCHQCCLEDTAPIHSLFAATASCGGVHGASEASEGKFLEALHQPPIAGLITHPNHCVSLHCLPPTRKKYEKKSTFIFLRAEVAKLPSMLS